VLGGTDQYQVASAYALGRTMRNFAMESLDEAASLVLRPTRRTIGIMDEEI